MLNHTDHSPEMKASYVEASHRISCNIFTHMAWLITDDYPEVGDDGLSIPNNMNKLSTLPRMSAEWLRAFQHQSTSKLHCTSPKKTGARRLFHSKNRVGSSSASTMSRDVLQHRQRELMNRQLEVASSYHRTSMTIHTVCILHP